MAPPVDRGLAAVSLNDSDVLRGLADRIRGRNRVVVFPESDDERIIAAARNLTSDGLARVILVGGNQELTGEGIDIVDPGLDPRIDEFATLYCQNRPRTKPGVARRIISKPLFFAGMLTRSGAADGLVAGAATATAKVIEASLLTIGPAVGIETPSSSFIMVFPEAPKAELAADQRSLLFADCAVNVAPSEEQLAEIAVASARTYASLIGGQPRVAMLSFSSRASTNHELARKVARATELAREKDPALQVDGELQADAALVPRVATAKLDDPGAVAGRANVLVFPSLESGNIAYKLTQYLGHAQAIGPVLQGFAHPVSDLSRGATVDDIVAATILTLAQGSTD